MKPAKTSAEIIGGCIGVLIYLVIAALVGGWLFMLVFNLLASYTHWSHISFWPSVGIAALLSALFNWLKPSK